MSDIDRYLSDLRSHLSDLDPKRVEEIVAEARSHLEDERARLHAAGMGEDEAIGEAIRTFGDPALVAKRLMEGNQRHRRPLALRAVGAVAIAFGTIFALLFLEACVTVVVRRGLFSLPTDLDLKSTAAIAGWVAYCCIGLLTGLVGGRRLWWIAALPQSLLVGWIVLALFRLPPTVWTEVGRSPLQVLGQGAAAVALVGGLGWLGSRLPPRRPLTVALTVVSGSVVGLIWMALLVFVVAASQDSGASAWFFGVLIAILLPVMIGLLIAGRRDRFLRRETFIAALSGLCGLGLLLTIGLALLLSGVWSPAAGHGHAWLARALSIVAAMCALGLLSALIYWHRTQPEPRSSQGNSSAD